MPLNINLSISWPINWRDSLIASLVIISFVSLFFVEPISQDLAYHMFSDSRTMLGISNFFDVVSNLPFLFVGLLGLFCIYQNNYLYTDYKLQNTLYQCTGKNSYKIILGDLGSAVPDKDNRYTCSYPPYEYRNKKGLIQIEISNSLSKHILSWGVGIILLSLIDNKTSKELLNLLFFKR